MSDDDDIEKLLREIDSSGSGGRSKKDNLPATRDSSDAASPGRAARALRTGLVSGVVCGAGVGVVTFFLQWLPVIDNPVSSGLGAFVGAFLTGATLTATRKG
jgi:Mg/Co/Ni transporter MgtE